MAEERKQTVVLDFEVDLEGSIESINSLTKANKALREERKNLNLLTKEGRQRTAEINTQIDKNTEKIKSNVSALEKQKINIGNYKSALDNIIPGLSGFLDKTVQGTKAVGGMSVAMKIMLGPIGLLILALGAIVKWLTGSEEGMDKLAVIMAKVGAVVDVISDRFIQLGKAIANLSLDGIIKSFSGVGEEMQKEIDAATDLAERIDILDDLNLALNIRLSEQENVIKNLIIQSRNRSLSEGDRMKKLVEAAALEKQLTGERIALRIAELAIITSEIQLRNSEKEAAQKSGETIIEFAKRIAGNNKILLSDRQKIAEQLEQYNGLLDNQANIQEKIQNQQDAISDKILENLEKERLALAEKAAQEEFNRNQALASRFTAKQGTNPEIDQEKTNAEVILDVKKRLAADIDKLNKKTEAEAIEDKRLATEIQKDLEFQKLDAAQAVAGGIAGLLDQQGEAYKLAASAQVIISTYAAAQKAYEAAFLPIPTVASPGLGVAFAAAAVLKGLANLAAINNVQFAEGGVVLKGRSHAHGGIPIEAEGDEIILTKGVYRNPQLRQMASAINVAGGGVRFADGGLVSNSITQPINQQFELRNIFKNMPPIEVGVKEISKVQNRVRVKEKISKR